MNGIDFYDFLKKNIQLNAQLGNYTFKKWLKNGNLQFEINPNQKKSIPPELIMMAYHIKKRNDKINFIIISLFKTLKCF